MNNYLAGTLQAPARNDGFSAVLREAVEGLRDQERCNPLSADGIREIISETALYNRYVNSLVEGMSAETAEDFRALADNTRIALMQEQSISNIQPVSALNLPILRKAWPKIGIKEALPTQALKVPEITVPHLIPHIIDPETGAKKELPAALRGASRAASSQKKVDRAPRSLPLANADVMPTGCPVSGGYTLDTVFSVVAVDIEVMDAGGANKETKTNVKVYAGRADTTANGSFRFTVTAAHSTGNETSDTVFGWVDFEAGTVTATSLNTGAASATAAKVTKVCLSGKIESTSNKRTTEIGYTQRNTKINVGTGEHFSASLPLEWLQDQLAMFNVDGTLKVIDIMTEVLAQKVDIEGIDFLQASFDRLVSEQPTVDFDRTFDVHPTGNFAHSPTEWLGELKRVIDNLASTMRNVTFFSGGKFVIVGNPIDMDLIPNAQWVFTAGGEDERDGVDVNYSIGALKGANRYELFSTQNIDAGALWVFFIPAQEDHKTYQYFPYTFNVMRTNEGFVTASNPNVPGVMMTKRHNFHEFRGMIGKVTILHNDGSLPA